MLRCKEVSGPSGFDILLKSYELLVFCGRGDENECAIPGQYCGGSGQVAGRRQNVSCEAVVREKEAVARYRGVIGFPACEQSLPQLVEITRNEGRMIFPRWRLDAAGELPRRPIADLTCPCRAVRLSLL